MHSDINLGILMGADTTYLRGYLILRERNSNGDAAS